MNCPNPSQILDHALIFNRLLAVVSSILILLNILLISVLGFLNSQCH